MTVSWWIATNVAQVTSSKLLTLTFTCTNGSASSEACVWGIEVEGSRHATASANGVELSVTYPHRFSSPAIERRQRCTLSCGACWHIRFRLYS